ncbi:MAG: hypothetical protein Q9202_003189 [Teloschistes flavicans]
MDPAMVKYANMAKNRYKYFRWTPRTGWLTFAYVAVVPAMFAYLGMWSDVSGESCLFGVLRLKHWMGKDNQE